MSNDQVVVITGAAGGIGRATARAFARGGARLAVVDLDRDALDSLVTELRAEGVAAESIASYTAEVTEAKSVQDYFASGK